MSGKIARSIVFTGVTYEDALILFGFTHGFTCVLVISNFNVSGTVEGPSLASLTLDGQPLAVGSGGTFGPIAVSIPAGDAGVRLGFRLTHPDGTTANHRVTFYQGLPQPFVTPSPRSLHARLGPGESLLVETPGRLGGVGGSWPCTSLGRWRRLRLRLCR